MVASFAAFIKANSQLRVGSSGRRQLTGNEIKLNKARRQNTLYLPLAAVHAMCQTQVFPSFIIGFRDRFLAEL